MKPLSKVEFFVSYIFQVVGGSILAMASIMKFLGSESGIMVFSELGISETRLWIAAIEGLAALLLFTPKLPHYGAILGIFTMTGAIFAHVSILGLSINNDGGAMVGMLSMVAVSCLIILWIRRRKIPFIGHTI